MGTIFNIQKFCVHDGDGIRTCVFFKGCPLHCLWCHNPEGLTSKPQLMFRQEKCSACGRCLTAECTARHVLNSMIYVDRVSCTACGKCAEVCLNDACEIMGRETTVEEIFEEVVQDKMFYDSTGGGLTLTGGEPSMQAEFALELIRRAKKEGISCAIESCGIGERAFYEACIELGCTFLYDLKCMDPVKHRKLTGADNGRILDNLLFLFERGADVILRMPFIPGLNDTDADLDALCAFLSAYKGKYRYAEIMPCHTLGVSKAMQLGVVEPPAVSAATDDHIARWTEHFAQNGISVRSSRD